MAHKGGGWLPSAAMSRRMIFLLVAALLAGACTATAESSTTTTTATAITSATTTTPAVTGTTGTTTTATTADSTTTTTGPVVTVIDIVLVDGTVDRVERFDVPLDSTVRVTVTGDVADEIHLHGYDLHADVTPQTEAVLEFDATIPGVFEIELEGSGVLIGELQVAP